jgi:hypothetical protein
VRPGLRVLLFQSSQPSRFPNLHPAVPTLSAIQCRLADAVLLRQFRDLPSRLMLFQNPMICSSLESPLFMATVLLRRYRRDARSPILAGRAFRGQVTTTSCADGCGQVYVEAYSFSSVGWRANAISYSSHLFYINYCHTFTKLRQNHWNGMAVLTLSDQQPACSHSESGARYW